MWNLSAPPGFQGLRTDKPLTVYQRHLPHWRQDGATYFVTFRLADSLPQSKLGELQSLKAEWERRQAADATAPESRPTSATTGPGELTRLIRQRVERWLDQGLGRCVLKQASLAAHVTSCMHHFDEVRYELDCSAVMPNHVHVVVRPLMPEVHSLEAILGGWKKYSSRRINRAWNTTGDLWQEESYDQIIRDEEHLWRVLQYIGPNPERADLPADSCPLWVRPQWVGLGWTFERPNVGRLS